MSLHKQVSWLTRALCVTTVLCVAMVSAALGGHIAVRDGMHMEFVTIGNPGNVADQYTCQAEQNMLELTLRTRDAETDQVVLATEKVDAANIAVAIVDTWNHHWCMTCSERLSAMVPRLNRALEGARKLGMPILWAPTDAAGMYAGHPQRERALAVPLMPVPREGGTPPVRFTAPVGRCLCGPGIPCIVDYGWDGMHPGLFLADDDFIMAPSTEEVYSLLERRNITHVVYMGIATNMCVWGKPGALRYMARAGLKCVLARDLTDAFTSYEPASGFTPGQGTRQTVEDYERAGVPTINVADEWRKAGLWDDDWIVETVRITPWGKADRPYFFEQSVTVTLEAPWLADVTIRYTLDGSEPDAASPLYEKPLKVSETTRLRTAVFRAGKPASVPTDADFVRLPPRPPNPDVYLDDLKYILDRYNPNYFWQPKVGQSYEGHPLRVRERTYTKGLGLRAPSSARYELKPEYDRFVALAGVDGNMVARFGRGDPRFLGRLLAMHPSVVFRVFIDGELAAESPVMRISQEPWRFDVPIPPGSRWINLVCMDAGSRNVLDLGNWVEAGFVTKSQHARNPRP